MKRRTRGAWGWWSVLALAGFGSLPACAPKIGDKCTISTDCSAQGDRLCDPTQPDGYCTIFNCEPNGCPDEAVCVAFNEPSCSSPAISRRFQRTFCMFVCESNNDCRSGYACLDTTNDPVRQVVDQNPQSTKICTVLSSTPAPAPAPDPAVCSSPDAGLPAVGDGGSDSAEGGEPGPDGGTQDAPAEADGGAQDAPAE